MLSEVLYVRAESRLTKSKEMSDRKICQTKKKKKRESAGLKQRKQNKEMVTFPIHFRKTNSRNSNLMGSHTVHSISAKII